MNKDIISNISEETIKRYSKRYESMGKNVKTLGWGSVQQQEYRFSQTLNCDIDFKSKTVLDIGCGFGDYYSFLKSSRVNFKKYIGWDINPDLICEAKKIHNISDDVFFEEKNIMGNGKQANAVADIGVMLGVLNFNLKEKADNYEYSKEFITKAFECVDKLLIVDFLSTYTEKSYPAEDFVFYHKPEVMLEYAFSLSENVVLRHNYSPIPQKEYILYIYKNQ